MIMKTKKFALLIILSMLVTGFAGAGSYIVEDDIIIIRTIKILL